MIWLIGGDDEGLEGIWDGRGGGMGGEVVGWVERWGGGEGREGGEEDLPFEEVVLIGLDGGKLEVFRMELTEIFVESRGRCPSKRMVVGDTVEHLSNETRDACRESARDGP